SPGGTFAVACVHRVEQRLRRRADAFFHPHEFHDTRHLDHSSSLWGTYVLHLRRTAACLFDIGAEVFPLCRHSFLASRVESSVLARARTLGAGRPRRVAILSDMPLRL